MEHATPPSIEPNLDHDHEEYMPLRFRRIDHVLGPATVLGLMEHTFQEELQVVSAEEPMSLKTLGVNQVGTRLGN
jgi:hypothetical protein